MAKRIFLCTADSYKHFAWSIQKDLAMQGHDIFCYFTDDTSLELVSYVLRQVSSADCLLIFTSPNAIMQTYELNNPFRRVLETAFTRHLPILPLMFMGDSFDSEHYEKHLPDSLVTLMDLDVLYLDNDAWDETILKIRDWIINLQSLPQKQQTFRPSKSRLLVESILEQGRKAEYSYERGNRYFLEQAYESAISSFSSSIYISQHSSDMQTPVSYSVYNNRAIAKKCINKFEDALSDINEAIKLRPDRSDILSNRSSIYYELGRNQEAIEDANQALVFNPDFAVAYNNRALAYFALRKITEALQDFDCMLRLYPNLVTFINRAKLYIDIGEHKKALEDLDSAIDSFPDEALGYTERGNLYMKLENYAMAALDFSKAIDLHNQKEDITNTHYSRGLALYKMGQFRDSITDFDYVIKMRPNFRDAYFHRTHAHTYIGQYLPSFRDYLIVLYLDSGFEMPNSRKKKKAR